MGKDKNKKVNKKKKSTARGFRKKVFFKKNNLIKKVSVIRVSTVELPIEKKIYIALSYIKGIGISSSKKMLKFLKIEPNIKLKELESEVILKIENYIRENFLIENALIREKKANIQLLIKTKHYRGIRHLQNLPVRGQSSRNARTRKKYKIF